MTSACDDADIGVYAGKSAGYRVGVFVCMCMGYVCNYVVWT